MEFMYTCLFVTIIFAILHCSCGENLPPVWDVSSYQVLSDGISESTKPGTSVAQLKCTDPEGDKVVYQKIASNTFNIRSNGTVILMEKLDYEASDNAGIFISFSCLDLDPRTDFPMRTKAVVARTIFTIDDANDNQPIFDSENAEGYSYIVSEKTPAGTSLEPSFTVRDLDKSENVLKELYFICDRTNKTFLATLEDTNLRTCTKFSVSFTQVLGTGTGGVYRGTIELKAELNYEDWPVYSSQLVAVDGGGAILSLSSTINIQFIVGDAQDSPPEFTNLGESVTVSEDIGVGTTLSFAVSARDGDTGQGAARPVKFHIVEDVNDVFDLAPAIYDPRTADTGVYSSRIIIKNSLDREAVASSYSFLVMVTEMDNSFNPPRETAATALATYSVFVSDVNDNGPLFDPSVYYASVTEFSNTDDLTNYQPVQIANLHIYCEDKDEPSNSQYEIIIVNQTFPGAYSISPAGQTFTGKGSIFLQVDDPRYLDYDQQSNRDQVIVLMAREVHTNERFSSSATIYITLTDINDNTPQFTETNYTISVSESTKIFPHPLWTFFATDADSGPNGVIRYRLQAGTSNKFAINPISGILTLESALDYDNKERQYVLLVYATDQSAIPRSNQTQITVNVLNSNDQAPVFRQDSYQTSARETSLQFFNPINITATDNEDGSGQITYRIIKGQSPNGAFALNKTTGVLSLKDHLAFDDTPERPDGQRLGRFTLTVEASDNGVPPQTNVVEVTINVIDENNHPPIMSPTVYAITLPELAQGGTFVADVNATDQDGEEFGRITYRLGPGNSGNFRVDPNSGIVTVDEDNNFDFDTRTSYVLMILATDGGAPQRTAVASVLVDITDSNNKAPTFSQFLYRATVNETSSIGTSVLVANASDDDSNQNLVYSISRVSYAASDGNGNTLSINDKDNYDIRNVFRIDDDGIIYVNGDLEKNIAQEVSFAVLCEDTNAELVRQLASTRVTIIILREPDKEIIFDVNRVVFTNEADFDFNKKNDVTTLVALDPFSEKPITRFIKLLGSSSFFNVEGSNIVLVKSLDFEKDPLEQIVIVSAVSEDGKRSATATVTISVLDINDNPPVFQKDSYVAEISENMRYPALVLKVLATDDDSSSFGPIQYRITGGLDAEDFTILQWDNEVGASVLVAKGKELNFNIRNRYNLEIMAIDNPDMEVSSTMSAIVQLTINIIDENNNVPYFKNVPSRNYVVPENAGTDIIVATIRAFDDDAGKNGKITYSLESGDDEIGDLGLTLFSIVSGSIYVTGDLLGRGGERFSFNVRASDNGEEPNSATLPIFISVLGTEDDDGNPKWIAPPVNFVVYAPEETPGYELQDLRFEVSARTGDEITFALSPFSEGYNSFQINEMTGVITVVDSLDREREETYELHVYAQDTNDTFLLRTGRSFFVQLDDDNDNDATFTNPKGYASCNTIKRPLEVEVVENELPNTYVYTLSACDPDSPGNNAVEYELYNDNEYCARGNNETDLKLNPDGQLFTNQIIDYEHRKEYIMCVRALSSKPVQNGLRKKRSFDMSRVDKSLDNVAYIVVTVKDVNDNGPEFPSPTAVAVVPTSPGNGPVHKLDAVDKDGQGYNAIKYLIEQSVFYRAGRQDATTVKDAFKLQSNTGAIFPTRPSYQEYMGGRFVLTVLAIDTADVTKTARQRITIYVHGKGEAVKLTLKQKPSAGRNLARSLINDLNRLDTRFDLKFISVTEHRMSDGVNLEMTDVCFLAVDNGASEVLNIRQVIQLLDQPQYQEILDKTEYKVEDRAKCYPKRSSEEKVKWRDLWWVLVAVAIFLFVCCLIVIIIVCVLYNNYKRYMETRKTYLVQQ